MAKPSAKRKPRKPKDLVFYDGMAEWCDADYDGKGGGAECINIAWATLYDAKNAKRLHKWLGQAIAYLEAKKGGG